MKFILEKKLILFYFLIAIIMVSVLSILYNNTQKIKSSSDLVEHTQDVLNKSNNVLLNVLNMETGLRGYIITEDAAFLEPFINDEPKLKENLMALELLCKYNPNQRSRVVLLNNATAERLAFTKNVIAMMRQHLLKKEEITKTLQEGKNRTDTIRNIINSINSEEFYLLTKRKIENESSNDNSKFLFLSLLTFILAIFVLIIIIIKNQKLKNTIAEELKQTSQYARSLIEASLDPLVTINADGKIMDVNNASVKVTGIQEEKLIGTDFSDYFTEPQKANEGYRQVFEKGFVADYPLTIKHKNGKLTDVLYNASVYKDDKGVVLGVFAAARDVTRQKLLSKYSLSLIEASRDPLVTISIEGKIMDMNQAKVNITGIEREKLIGTNFIDHFTEPLKAREVYLEVFSKGFVVDSPLTLRHKNGKLTDVLFNGSVYKDDRGNVLGAVVVARDITEQKRFENELIEAKSKAERATLIAEDSNKLKEAFLANMSHEIRTPMNAIIGFSDILFKGKLEEKEREYVKTIKNAGENLLTIINDILDISKIEAGMMIFEEKTFSIKDIFKSLNVMLMGKAKEKNLELTFSSEKEVPDVLLGDHTRLTQILINLAGNAIKFTQKGSINVCAKVLNTNGSVLVQFTVQDTGIGISSDKLDHIFERFRQAESHTTRKYGGTGLGLSIAKQLVELQGGTLTVKSELKKGSIFTFCIPYKKTSQLPEKLITAERKFNIENLAKLKILLIEDNELNVKLILSLFSEYNLNVTVAENGSVGLEKMKGNNYDIILMDMEMPVMNGYETATIIRTELMNNIPIIAMTANAMSGEKERCLRLGMNDYISKPINANLLFEKMHDLTINT